jgi:outer membrane lipoprotein SlyB
MADGKRESSAVAVASPSSVAMARGTRGGNPLEELSARIKAIEAGFRTWMAKQPTHIEAAVSTAVGAVQGGALGGLMGSLTADGGSPFPMPQPPPNADPQAMASLKQAQVVILI